MTVTLNPFARDQKALVSIGSAYSVTLGKMLDAGKTVDASHLVLPYVRAANIQDDGLRLADVHEMPFSKDEAARLDLRRGDLLVVEGGAVGTSAILDRDMPGWSFQKTVNRVRATGDCSTRYLGYVLRAYRDAGVIDLVCNGSTIPHLTAEKLRALRIPQMRSEDQLAISNYLDRETARIDTLIEEQQRLIEMLRERRIGAIRAEVSGVPSGGRITSEGEWFGTLPNDWTTAPIRYNFSVTLGKMLNAGKKPGNDATSAPYLTAGSIQPNHLLLDDSAIMAFTPAEVEAYSLLSGDVVVVEGGAGYGRSHYLRESLPGWGFQNHVARLRPSTGRVIGEFLAYCLKACLASGHIEANNRTATLPSLSRDVLGGIRIPVPSRKSQEDAVARLNEQTAKVDTLIAEAERFIELSRERRSALITAAVTGEIDVREAPDG